MIFLLLSFSPAQAQGLRFSNHREVQIPEYATIRIGPFYSDIFFSQSAGYRYTRSRGDGVEFLFDNQRGTILKDGPEYPLITDLTLRNYLLITRTMDLDLSLRLSYAHYPLETQEDELLIDLVPEGIFGSLSTAFSITPFIRGTLSDSMEYRTDYVDLRGVRDEFGGQDYQYFQNKAGLDLDWNLFRDDNIGLSLSRMDMVPMDDAFADQHRITYGESLMYERQWFPGFILGAEARFAQTDYREEERTDVAVEEYSLFSRFDRGAGFPLTEASTLSLRLGFARGSDWSGDSDQQVDSQSVVGQASLRTDLTPELWHALTYTKGLRDGFRSAIEIYQEYGYKISWQALDASVMLHTSFSEVDSGNAALGQYTAWTSGLEAGYPLTGFAKLLGSSTYSVRNNSLSGDDAVDAELGNDYATWANQAGVSMAVAKNLDFSVWFKRMERLSDSPDLAYVRDVFSAIFTYRHKF